MTHLAHPSAFPTEIYERIIGWIGNLTQVWSLHAEKLSMNAYRIKLTTLYSCALTCRAWLPMSRVCLYHHPTFLSPNRIPFERLVQTLDAKPWLGNLINALAVIDNHKSTMDSKVSDRDCAGDISHTWPVILSGRISSLPRLCTLHVTLADGLARHPQYIRSMRTIGSAVTTLSLEWYHSGSFADLFRLISAFPNLRTLMLAGGLWAPNGTRTAISSRHLPPLSRLTITNSQPYKDGVWKEITYRMLQAAADSIAIIELDPACVPYFTSDDQQMSAAHPIMPRLHTLYIHVGDNLWTSLQYRGVNWMLRSAPALKRCVLDYALSTRFKAASHRRSDFEVVITELTNEDNILSYLSTATMITSITLLLHDESPIDSDILAMDAKKAAMHMQDKLSRLKQHADIKVIWSSLTEDFQRFYLFVADDQTVVISLTSPPELAHCTSEWEGQKERDGLDITIMYRTNLRDKIMHFARRRDPSSEVAGRVPMTPTPTPSVILTGRRREDRALALNR